MSEQNLHPQAAEYLEALKEDTPQRDSDLAAQGRANFLAEADSLRAPTTTPWLAGIREAIASFRIQGNRRLATAIASILIALILTLGAVGGTVYASQDSLPNQSLYAVKTFTEDLRLRFADQPMEKINLLEKFTQRRVEELSALSNQGEDLPQGTISRLELHTETMLHLAAEEGEGEITQSLNRIRKALQAHEEVIARLQAQESGNALEALNMVQEKLQQKILLTEQGLENPSSFRKRMKSPTPFAPTDTDRPGKPEGTGTPKDKGKPEDAGTPEDKGKPEDIGTPENKGKPEDVGPPDGDDPPGSVGPPEDKGKPEAPGPPDEIGKLKGRGRELITI